MSDVLIWRITLIASDNSGKAFVPAPESHVSFRALVDAMMKADVPPKAWQSGQVQFTHGRALYSATFAPSDLAVVLCSPLDAADAALSNEATERLLGVHEAEEEQLRQDRRERRAADLWCSIVANLTDWPTLVGAINSAWLDGELELQELVAIMRWQGFEPPTILVTETLTKVQIVGGETCWVIGTLAYGCKFNPESVGREPSTPGWRLAFGKQTATFAELDDAIAQLDKVLG